MDKKWEPDPRVIKCLEEEAKKRGGKAIFANSDGETTVGDILDQVKKGTEDGKRLHDIMLLGIEVREKISK